MNNLYSVIGNLAMNDLFLWAIVIFIIAFLILVGYIIYRILDRYYPEFLYEESEENDD